jgi:CoA-binding protein
MLNDLRISWLPLISKRAVSRRLPHSARASTRRDMRLYRFALVVTDSASLALALAVSTLVRTQLDSLSPDHVFDARRYGLAYLVLVPMLIGILWLRHAYDPRHLLGGPEEYARVISGCTYGTFLVVVASYFNGSEPLVSRTWLLLFWVVSIALLGSTRFTARRVAYALRGRGRFIRRALVAGASDEGVAIALRLAGNAGCGVEVAGFLDDYLAPGMRVANASTSGQAKRSTFTVLGHPRDVGAISARERTDLVVVVPSALTWDSQRMFWSSCSRPNRDLEVRVAPTPLLSSAASVETAALGNVHLVYLRPSDGGGLDALLKRIVDFTVAAVLLVALAPAFVWAAASAGPRATGRRKFASAYPALLSVLRGKSVLIGPHAPAHERPGLISSEWLEVPLTHRWTIWQHIFCLWHAGVKLSMLAFRGQETAA